MFGRHYFLIIFLLDISILAAQPGGPESKSDGPGRCRDTTSTFSAEEGGCLHFAGHTVWGRKKENEGNFGSAEDYCSNENNFKTGGYSDWRLPEQSEFERLSPDIQNQNPFAFTWENFFWTRTKGSEGSWISFPMTPGDSYFGPFKTLASVICVREPRDRDRDGVPDSSDRCSGTARDAKVERSGERKGCASADAFLKVAPGEDACRKLSEDRCRETAGCGWGNYVKFCFDVTTFECPYFPEEWWCRAKGCRWVDEKEKCRYRS